MRTCSGLLAPCLLAGLLAGCGGRLGQVKGMVTLAGRPVADAELFFKSKAKSDQEYFGVSGADGAYQVSYRMSTGMPAGAYEVRVTRYVLGDGSPLPTGEEGDAIRSEGRAFKEIYHFETEINTGDNEAPFELNLGKRKEDGDTH